MYYKCFSLTLKQKQIYIKFKKSVPVNANGYAFFYNELFIGIEITKNRDSYLCPGVICYYKYLIKRKKLFVLLHI